MKIHKNLTHERWFKFTLFEQMANIGCDVDRAIRWKNKGDAEMARHAFERSLELLDATLIDPKNKMPKRKEIGRVKEVWIDYFYGNNEYKSSDKLWYDYFYAYSFAAALQRGR